MQIVHYFYFFFPYKYSEPKAQPSRLFLAQPGVLVYIVRLGDVSKEGKGSSLRMISRQTRMAASAPMLSFSVWPSWMSSQFSPQKPSGQSHRYRSLGSWLTQTPPFRQGRSRHSFRSMQPLPSGDMTRPSPQLDIFCVFFRFC